MPCSLVFGFFHAIRSLTGMEVSPITTGQPRVSIRRFTLVCLPAACDLWERKPVRLPVCYSPSACRPVNVVQASQSSTDRAMGASSYLPSKPSTPTIPPFSFFASCLLELIIDCKLHFTTHCEQSVPALPTRSYLNHLPQPCPSWQLNPT